MNLIRIDTIPLKYQSVFPYETFNHMQSRCYEYVMENESNIVLCAPTGCGKTVIAELSFINAMMKRDKPSLMLYVSPLRSLCQEKVRNWQNRFDKTGLIIQEYTGDSMISFPNSLKANTLLCTTPEKLDLATRSCKKKSNIFCQLSLLVVDEVHMLGETRGAVLEAMLSRILYISDQNSELYHTPPIRIVALSATVPNYQDIAQWLRVPSNIIQKTVFGDEYRESKLVTKVFGYTSASNDWMFENTLTPRVSSIIKQYSDDKPVLIFCCTRKSCEKTASKLCTDFKLTSNINVSSINDKSLQECLKSSVGFHTAGLNNNDRSMVEHLFLRGAIRFLCTTSTLAQGINLPAHMVIIKGTKHYCDNELQEYTSPQILQMAGRAGRPQFHDEGLCVIMTEKKNIHRYEGLINNSIPIESSLLGNLAEHLNAEITLGFIQNQDDVIRWLMSTYMYIRVQKNPLYYHLIDSSRVKDFLQDLCLKYLNLLFKNHFIIIKQDGEIESSQIGILCSQYGIMINTMVKFNDSSNLNNILDVLLLLSSANEFSEFIVRQEDKQKLRIMSANPFLRFSGKNSDDSNFYTPETKVYLLINSVLSQGKIEDWCFSQEFTRIKKIANRLLTCLFYLQVHKKSFHGAENTLVLLKCISKSMWENDFEKHIQQINKIGNVYSKKLQKGNFDTIDKLRKIEAYQIERLTNHRIGWGVPIVEEISQIPEYSISMIKEESSNYVNVTIQNLSKNDPSLPYHKASLIVGVEKDDLLIANIPINHVTAHYYSTFRIEIPNGYLSSDIIAKIIDHEFLGIDVEAKVSKPKLDQNYSEHYNQIKSKPNVDGQKRIDTLSVENIFNDNNDEIVWIMGSKNKCEDSKNEIKLDSDFWDDIEFSDSEI